MSGEHISVKVSKFALTLTQLRSAGMAHKAYCCESTLIILDRNANLKKEK